MKTVRAIENNTAPQIAQDLEQEQPKAPKIFRETCQIDFSLPAQKIHNFVRGLSPLPAAWTILQEKTCKIFATEVVTQIDDHPLEKADVGTFWTDNKKKLWFKTGEGILAILELQTEGKKRLPIEAFLAGNKL